MEEYKVNYKSLLIDKNGKEYRYTVCQKNMGRFFAAIGGVFVGMISVGLAELQEYHLVAKCKVPAPVAIATSIFVVHAEESVLNQVFNIIILTIPGVIIGGQIGPALQKKLPEDIMKVGVSVLFVLVGALMLFTLVR